MRRLLIVDDEYHVVDALYELFSLQTEMDLELYTAYSGSQALEVLGRYRIDVVLLDISMPGLSGMDVYEAIRRDWPSCRTVFLTGSNRFEHLYQVSRDRNVSFLLKTESNQTILKTVAAAVESIEVERRTRLLVSEADKKGRALSYMLERDIFRKALHGYALSDVKAWGALYPASARLRLDAPMYLFYVRVPGSGKSSEDAEFHLRLLTLMEKGLDDRFRVSLASTRNGALLLVAQASDASDAPAIGDEVFLTESLDTLVGLASDTLSSQVCMVLLRKPATLETLQQTCESLRRAAESIFEKQTDDESMGYLLADADFSRTEVKSGLRGAYPRELAEQLHQALAQGSTEASLAVLESFRQALSMDDGAGLQAVSAYQTLLSALFSFVLANHLEDALSDRISLNPLYQLQPMDGWDAAFAYLRRLIRQMLPLYMETRRDNGDILVDEIKRYIDANLGGKLTLTRIANHVNYTNSYVSHLFARITGAPLSAYIMDKRVDKARKLLENTNESIQVIASRLGFDTSQYFSSVFKKKTGMSPKDYRNQGLTT